MRKAILIPICLLVCLFLIVGCSPEQSNVQTSDEMTAIEDNVTADNETAGDNETTEDNETEESSETGEEENRTAEENRALIEQLMQEQGINATEDDEEEEETGPEGYTIELINMRGEPEKNLDIEVGDSVTWISRQPNYVHRIQLRLKLENGAFGETILDPAVSLTEDEEFTYNFDEQGYYQWYSKTNYPTTSGYINVTE